MGKPRKIEYREWDYYGELKGLSFGEKARRYLELKLQLDKLEPEKKALGEELEVIIMAGSEGVPVLFNGMVCSRRNGGQPSRIDATKLLEAGVDADVIAAATVPGGKYTYFEMRDPAKQKDNRKHKNKSDEEGDDGE